MIKSCQTYDVNPIYKPPSQAMAMYHDSGRMAGETCFTLCASKVVGGEVGLREFLMIFVVVGSIWASGEGWEACVASCHKATTRCSITKYFIILQ